MSSWLGVVGFDSPYCVLSIRLNENLLYQIRPHIKLFKESQLNSHVRHKEEAVTLFLKIISVERDSWKSGQDPYKALFIKKISVLSIIFRSSFLFKFNSVITVKLARDYSLKSRYNKSSQFCSQRMIEMHEKFKLSAKGNYILDMIAVVHFLNCSMGMQ